MIPLLIGVAALTVGTALVAALLAVLLRLVGRRPRLRVFVWVVLGSIPVHAFGTVPAALGIGAAHRLVGTRSDERAYAGPQLDGDGRWRLQAPGALLPGPSGYELQLRATDGVPIRAFAVPHTSGAGPRAVAVLVHGLFRGGLELEPVAAELHALGCYVVLVEMRNHGGSGRAAATFGRDERLDVEAAVAWVRARDLLARTPLILFGVSLGTATTVLAAAELDPPPDAIVLDAPLDDVLATAHRMLAEGPRGRRGFAFPQPFRSMILTWLELAAAVDLGAIRPLDALGGMRPLRAGLVIGGGEDVRCPPAVARAVFEALPIAAPDKELWIREGSGHGDVWRDDLAGYRERLSRLVDRVGVR